jgi:hypothetical protein
MLLRRAATAAAAAGGAAYYGRPRCHTRTEPAAAATSQVKLDEVRAVSERALRLAGLHEHGCTLVADVITAAERDGCQSHGLFRLPGYCRALRLGKVDGTRSPTVVTPTAAGVVVVDAGGCFAPLAFEVGLPLLASKARENGVAVLSIKNLAHFHAVWWVPQPQRTARSVWCNRSLHTCGNLIAATTLPNHAGTR